MSLVKISRVFK